MGLCPTCLLTGPATNGLGTGDNGETVEADEVADHSQKTASSGERMADDNMTGAVPGLGRFGDYDLITEIARGGMGVVYRARQASLNREVALKMILSGRLASEADIKRFCAEAEAAAQLQHPNIVAVHEVGECRGQHYFSMDFVEGKDLAQLAKDCPMGSEKAAVYVKKVATAVHYAHEQGIIHRDLKPQNILIDRADEPRVTDFGLAKRVEFDTGLTASGAVLGSPGYMAPEQAGGRNAEVGPGTDVYALGAILYHLLTGRSPFRAATPLETLKQVTESEPAAPRSLNPSIPVDLETVCLKCLEKQPARRYESAKDLADELGRYLRHEPVRARRASLRERAAKWAKRNPTMVAMSAVVMAVAMLGFGGVFWQLQATKLALHQANQNAIAEATARAPRLAPGLTLHHDGPVASVVFSRDGRRILSASHDKTARIWDARTGEVIRELRGHQGVVGGAAYDLEEKRVLTFSFDTQFRFSHLSPIGDLLESSRIPRFSDQTARLWDSETGREVAVLLHPDQVVDATFSPDGRKVITASWDHKARVWNATTGEKLKVLVGHAAALLTARFSPDSRHLVTTSSGYTYNYKLHPGGGGGSSSTLDESSVARIWDVESGSQLTSLKNRTRTAPIMGGPGSSRCRAAFSPDGRRVVTAARHPANLVIWNVESGRAEAPLRGHEQEVSQARFSPEGARVVTASVDETARIWDARSGRQIAELISHEGPVLYAEFSPDGTRVVTASADGTARVWDAETGAGVAVLIGHTDKVYQARFSPDGMRIVTASEDKTLRLWDAATLGQLSRVLRGHRGAVVRLDFSPDGRRVVTGSKDRTARTWDVATGTEVAVMQGYAGIRAQELREKALGELTTVRFSPDGRLIVTVAEDDHAFVQKVSFSGKPVGLPSQVGTFSPARLWDAGDHTVAHLLQGHECGVSLAVFSPDSGRLLSVPDGRIRKTVRTRGTFGRGWGGSSSELQGPLAVRVWDTKTGNQIVTLEGHSKSIGAAAFSPDGNLIATADAEQVRVWSAHDGKELRALQRPPVARHLDFAPDSRRLLVEGVGHLGIWDAQTGKNLVSFESSSLPFTFAELSRDASRVLAHSPHGDVHVFDSQSGEVLVRLDYTETQLRQVLLSPDGQLLVTIAWDEVARVWDADSGEQLRVLEGHDDDILFAAFSPDGEWLGTASEDYTARLWPVSALRGPLPFQKQP